MDKKLLLTIQYVCNGDGVRIPWDKVGRIMGAQISDGAVIQHLAKLRQRMVAQNLSVPPPLRRGGGYMTTTFPNANLGSESVSSKKGKSIAVARSPSSMGVNYDDEDEFDVDKASDSGEDFGTTRSKRVKREAKNSRRSSKVKVVESDDDNEIPSKIGVKRKRQGETSFAPSNEQKGKAMSSKAISSGHRSTTGYDSHAEIDSSDEVNDITVKRDPEYISGRTQFVGTSARYLRVHDLAQPETKERKAVIQTYSSLQHKFDSSSKIIVLRFGDSKRFENLLEDLGVMGLRFDDASETESSNDDGEEEIETPLNNGEDDIVDDSTHAAANIDSTAPSRDLLMDVNQAEGSKLDSLPTQYGMPGVLQTAPAATKGNVSYTPYPQLGNLSLGTATFNDVNLHVTDPLYTAEKMIDSTSSFSTGFQEGSYVAPDGPSAHQGLTDSRSSLTSSMWGNGYQPSSISESYPNMTSSWNHEEDTYASLGGLRVATGSDLDWNKMPGPAAQNRRYSGHQISPINFDSALNALYDPLSQSTGYTSPGDFNRGGGVTLEYDNGNQGAQDQSHLEAVRGLDVNRFRPEYLTQAIPNRYQDYPAANGPDQQSSFLGSQQPITSYLLREAPQPMGVPDSVEPFFASISPHVTIPLNDVSVPDLGNFQAPLATPDHGNLHIDYKELYDASMVEPLDLDFLTDSFDNPSFITEDHEGFRSAYGT